MCDNICNHILRTRKNYLIFLFFLLGVDANGKGLLYDGIADCIVKIWKTEGFMGFYKGLIPNYLRLGPHTILCLVFWEKFKLIQKSYFPKEKKL